MKCYPPCLGAFDTSISISMMMWSTVGKSGSSFGAVVPSPAILHVKCVLLIMLCLHILSFLFLLSFASAPTLTTDKKDRRRRRRGEGYIVIKCFNWKHQKHKEGGRVFMFWMYSSFLLGDGFDGLFIHLPKFQKKVGSGQSGCKARDITD